MAQGLSLHTFRRKQKGQCEDIQKHCHHNAFGRTVAWRCMDICHLGRVSGSFTYNTQVDRAMVKTNKNEFCCTSGVFLSSLMLRMAYL